jgi:hypothetical protein
MLTAILGVLGVTIAVAIDSNRFDEEKEMQDTIVSSSWGED